MGLECSKSALHSENPMWCEWPKEKNGGRGQWLWCKWPRGSGDGGRGKDDGSAGKGGRGGDKGKD